MAVESMRAWASAASDRRRHARTWSIEVESLQSVQSAHWRAALGTSSARSELMLR